MSILSNPERLKQLVRAEYERDAATTALAKRDFATFVKVAWHVLEPSTPLLWNWHIDALALHLQAVYTREITRLLINIAPGHAKSSIVSVLFPVWCWINDPYSRWLCASHGLDLSLRDNGNRRRLIESEWFQTHYGNIFTLAEDQNAKSFFQNDKNGYFACAATRSSVTGKRASHLLIDDPHNANEGDANRKATVEWYGKSWVSRINDQQTGPMVVVGQCIHSEDLSNHLLKLGGWEHLCLPSEFEPKRRSVTKIGWEDPRKTEGELLWPKKFPREVLDDQKKTMGSMNYAAQHQQRPVPAGGSTFKQQWLRYFKETPDAYVLQRASGTTSVLKEHCRRFAVADLAISLKQSADFTVIQVYDVTPQNDLLLIYQIRAHMDNPEQQRVIRLIYLQQKPDYFTVESVAYQLALVQQLRREPMTVGDFLVTDLQGKPLANPEEMDKLFWNFGAFLVRDEIHFNKFKTQAGFHIVRVEGDKDYFRFAIKNQGYCKVVEESAMDSSKISVPVREYRPPRGQDKGYRASIAAIQFENEKFFFREGDPYLLDVEPELLLFPRAPNDDIVDAISIASEDITTRIALAPDDDEDDERPESAVSTQRTNPFDDWEDND